MNRPTTSRASARPTLPHAQTGNSHSSVLCLQDAMGKGNVDINSWSNIPFGCVYDNAQRCWLNTNRAFASRIQHVKAVGVHRSASSRRRGYVVGDSMDHDVVTPSSTSSNIPGCVQRDQGGVPGVHGALLRQQELPKLRSRRRPVFFSTTPILGIPKGCFAWRHSHEKTHTEGTR